MTQQKKRAAPTEPRNEKSVEQRHHGQDDEEEEDNNSQSKKNERESLEAPASPTRGEEASAAAAALRSRAKSAVPNKYFREKTDKILDDYTDQGKHLGILEFAVTLLTAVASGMTPAEDASPESCTSWASLTMVLNVLPFACCIAFSAIRKKMAMFFALVTGGALAIMSVIVGMSKIKNFQSLELLMNLLQISLDTVCSLKLGIDMAELLFIIEPQQLLVPLYFVRHYVFHVWCRRKSSAGARRRSEHRSAALAAADDAEEGNVMLSRLATAATREHEEEERSQDEVSPSLKRRLMFDSRQVTNLRNRHAAPHCWDVSDEMGIASPTRHRREGAPNGQRRFADV